jgi:CRISPR-associated protein Cas1
MHPIPISERISIVYVDRGCLEQDGHQLVISDANRLTAIPVGKVAVLMLGPGVSVTHAAIKLCADEKCLLLWSGEHGVRLYAAGNPRSSAEAIVRQALLHANPASRLSVARKVFRIMFGEDAPLNRSVDQLRGLEGARVKKLYNQLADQYNVGWTGKVSDLSCPVNAALAGVNAALYGVTEAAILALGYSPAIGFVHAGDPRSFVFDVADTVKFQSVAPLAFALAQQGGDNIEHRSRTAARDLFARDNLTEKIVSNIEILLNP